MTEMQSAARIAMASKLLADAARDEGAAARSELHTAMATVGAERVRVTDHDGEDLGAASLAGGKPAARVVDRAAFVAWIRNRYPDTILEQVNPVFEERLLRSATVAGDPVDIATGEVIPGVHIVRSDAYLTVRPNDVARDRMRTLLAGAGVFTLALPAPSTADGA